VNFVVSSLAAVVDVDVAPVVLLLEFEFVVDDVACFATASATVVAHVSDAVIGTIVVSAFIVATSVDATIVVSAFDDVVSSASVEPMKYETQVEVVCFEMVG